jgi:hypothetical protein
MDRENLGVARNQVALPIPKLEKLNDRISK